MLREAIAQSGKVALTRVVITQRERTVALRPMGSGLVAHTLNEERDLNPAKSLFEGVQHVKIDPEMVKLATQLIDGQTGPLTLRIVTTRLRAMIRRQGERESLTVANEPAYSERNVDRPDGHVARKPRGAVCDTGSPRPKKAGGAVLKGADGWGAVWPSGVGRLYSIRSRIFRYQAKLLKQNTRRRWHDCCFI